MVTMVLMVMLMVQVQVLMMELKLPVRQPAASSFFKGTKAHHHLLKLQ